MSMSDSTKALVGGLLASVTIVGSLAVMADCSKQVSRTGAEAVEACVRRGGVWIGDNSGVSAVLDTCLAPEKRK